MELFLAQFRTEEILFVPNPGNAGDWLISASTPSAMAKARVNFKVADRLPSLKNRTVFLGGGGNFINLYTEMRQLLETCLHDAARIVLLPHTIRGNADVIKLLDACVTVWCRRKTILRLCPRSESRPGLPPYARHGLPLRGSRTLIRSMHYRERSPVSHERLVICGKKPRRAG